MKIIAKKDFASNFGEFIKGEEIKNLSYKQINLLNEKGLIEPLTYRDLVLIKREINNCKNIKEEKE